MQRRRPRGLGAVGGTGWGSEPGQPLVSDSEDEEPLQCPNAGGTASPQVVAESDPEELDVSPDVHVLRKRLPPPLTSGRNDLDVGGPKKRRLDPETPPNPSSQPLNHSVSHEGVVGPDAERWRGSHPTVDVGSDSDDEEHPKSAVFHPNRHQPALVRNADPNVTPRTLNPDLGGPRNGRWALTVNSDADVEEVEFLQSIRRPKILQKTPNVPQSIGVGVEIPQSDPGSPRNGFRVVVEGGDTDVEVAESSDLVAGRAQISGQRMLTVGSDADAEDTGRPQRLRMTPNALKVKMETPNPPPGGPREELEVLTMGGDTEVEEYGVDSVLCSTTHRVTRKAPNLFNIKADGSQKGRRPEPEVGADPDGGDPLRGDPDPDVGRSKIRLKLALVDSDTDVEEDVAYPRIPAGTPEPLIGAAVVMETPNPDPKGPQVGDQSLEVGSDIDVEEEELNPDVPHPKNPKTPRIAPKDPDVLMETPNPHLKGPQVGDQSLEVGSDTDVEEEELNPDVPHPKNPKTPRIGPKDPDVLMETPNPDLKGSQVGDQSLEVGSDTDVEEEELNPDVPHPKNPKTPRIGPKDPDVLMETPNPDLKGSQVGDQSLEVGSDTDVEEEELNPNVPHPKHPKTPHITPKDPDVLMETQNPDPKESQVGDQSLEVGSDADVEEQELNPDVPHPKNPKTPRIAPKDPDVVMETPNPHLKGPQVGDQSLEVGSDTDVEVEELNPDLPCLKNPKTPQITPQNLDVVVMETPNPDPKGPQVGDQSLEVGSDTDVEEEELNPDLPCLKNPKTPRIALQNPAVVMETPNPDLKGSQVGDQSLEADSDTDVEEEELNPDVPHPKNPKTPRIGPKDPDVLMETTNPDLKRSQVGDQSLEVGSDTDVEEGELNPVVPHPKNPQTPRIAPKNPDVVVETPNPDLKGSEVGDQSLEVGSDTDVEEEELNPVVLHPKNPQTPQIAPKDLDVVMETPNPDLKRSQVGDQSLEVGSDTDVEEEELNPDVPHPKAPKTPQITPQNPAVVVETPNPHLKGSEVGDQSLEVGSDTDVEEQELNPDVPHPKNPKTPRIAPKDPDVVMETPNPHLKGPQVGDQSLEADSDTDVEEQELNPDVPHPKNPKTPRIAPKDPDVVMETPNPHLKGPQVGDQSLEADSDTDVEEQELNPDVPHPKNPKTPRIAPKDPDVVMETPNPHLKGPQVGDQSLEADSDTDVEEQELNPDVPHPKNPKTPRIAPKDPDVVMETPNPHLKGPQVGDQSLEADSDTDVEEQELNPDVPHPKNPKTARIGPKDPDVLMETPNPDAAGLNGDPDEDLGGVESPRAPTVMRGVTDSAALGASAPDVAPAVLAAPHPDVPLSLSPQGGCDPHGEDAAPAAHIGRFWTRIRPQNPNVGCDAMGGGTDVRQTDPKRGESIPKWQSLAPEPCGDGGVGGTVPKRHDPAPNTDVESPKPNDGTQRHRGETSKMGSDTVEVPVPKSPDLAPNLGHPNGDADVTESDAEAEDDPDLFLALTQNFLLPTQNFLPPTQNFLPPTQSFLPPPTQDTTPAWDPEEPTQCFYHPEEEEEKEEEEEEPPQSRVATRVAAVTPAQEDVGTNGAPSKDVAEGPHHNQRQARARGGGASGKRGGAKAPGGGAMTEPAPLRRSPRLLARLLPAEPKMGRGQDEPRPLPAARPRRGGHAPLQKKAREEEPADITKPQLRPRGSSASSSPKVLFTGVVASPGMEAALGVLGGSMAASVFDCTHLVTDRVRRTVKFLCAVARGIAIVTPNWLHESSRSGRVLPPGPFLVRDSQQEQHFGFNLSQALSRARRRPLLQGYEVHVTPSVRPEPEHMRDIITCSGGTFLPAMPCTYGPRRLVISCPEDSESWRPALEAQLPLLSAELLLTGLLRQQLQLQLFFLTPLGPPQDPPLSPRRLRVRRDPSGTRRRGQLRVK